MISTVFLKLTLRPLESVICISRFPRLSDVGDFFWSDTIPFSLSLPKAPAALNTDTMTDDQLHAALQVGIKEIQNGDTVDAASAFAPVSYTHLCWLQT